MLGYISKNRQPPKILDGFPLARQDSQMGTIYRLKSVTIANPHDLKPIKIDDNLSVFKITDTLNPLDLVKNNPIGDLIKLNNHSWHVPKLRVFPSGCQLPTVFKLTEQGKTYEVKDCHLEAWNLGETILYKWLSGEETPDSDAIVSAIATILKTNYWITDIDLMVYGEISTDVVLPFFEHCIDWQARVAFLATDDCKKKLAETDLN